VENAANDDHGAAIAGDLDCSADKPPCKNKHQGVTTARIFRNKTSYDGINDRASSKGRTDGTLSAASGVVKVVALVRQDDQCAG
jgi:hypothetical protein